MRREELEKKLLLYWSGELGPAERDEVEERLARDREASEFLADLDLLRGDLQAEPCPEPPRGQLDTALHRHLCGKHRPVLRAAFLRYAAVAALFLMGFGLASYVALRKLNGTGKVVERTPSKTQTAAPTDRPGAATHARGRRRTVGRRAFRKGSEETRKRVARLKERINALKSKYVQ